MSKGHGFVQFDSEEAAQKAIDKLNGTLSNDKQVFVGPFVRKQERESTINKEKFNNVFVKNISEGMTEEDLTRIFGEFGPITSVVVMRDGDGKSKCFGFVNFENVDDAAMSDEALNGQKFDDKEWYVGKAQKKSEREIELKSRFEQNMKEAVEPALKSSHFLLRCRRRGRPPLSSVGPPTIYLYLSFPLHPEKKTKKKISTSLRVRSF